MSAPARSVTPAGTFQGTALRKYWPAVVLPTVVVHRFFAASNDVVAVASVIES